MDRSVKTLADFTSPALVLSELQSKTASDVIAELCLALQRENRLVDSPGFYEAVMAREELGSTCFPPGWAVPHARLKGLAQLSFAVGRTSQPLAWFGNGIRVHTVFLFAVPEADARTYLDLIAAVAKLNQNASLLQRLQHAHASETVFEILNEVALRNRQPNAPASCASH